jgi:hypothetical protein
MRRLLGIGVALSLSLACNEYDLTTYANSDIFTQNPADKVDILLVVDDSCSMEPYQERLGTNFDAFLTYFTEANVDYHIGVVSTTVSDAYPYPEIGCTEAVIAANPKEGRLAQSTFISNLTPDAPGLFDQLVNRGICGSSSEMGLEAARLALSEPALSTNNAGFLREDAALSLIFVSDEEDVSPSPVNEYINFFRDVKGQRSRDIFNASALTVTNPATCPNGISPGTRYVDVVAQTRGVSADLCAQDFGPAVTELSLNASRLRDTFYLSDLPVVASLEVAVADEVIPCDSGRWTYEEEEVDGILTGLVRFDRLQMPQPSERISVSYDPGNGGVAEFCGGAQ